MIGRATAATALDGEQPARSFAPRRALPNGRAVIGALLVATAAVGTFAVATHDPDDAGTAYLVLVDDIEPGETLAPADVRLESMVLPPGLAANALRSPDGLAGATALAHLRGGTVLDVRDLRGAPSIDGATVVGAHEVTIPIVPERAPMGLRRGDRVTLLAYSIADETLHTAIEDALVLGLEVDAAGIGASGGSRLTLAVDDADAVAAVVRWSFQPLTVVLTTRAIDDVYPPRLAPATTTPPGPVDVASASPAEVAP